MFGHDLDDSAAVISSLGFTGFNKTMVDPTESELERESNALRLNTNTTLRNLSHYAKSKNQSLMDLEAWESGDLCEEDGLAFCSRCKPSDLPSVVYVTTGSSSAFHARDSCEALKSGQDSVERRGGEPAPIKNVNVQIALGQGKVPCLVCMPNSRKM